MNKEKVEAFISRLCEKNKQPLSEHQKELIFRCFLLELDEADIELIVMSDLYPQKEEYIIASFLDGIDRSFIEDELMLENSINVIKGKRLDYLMEKFRTSDPEYIKLKNEINNFDQYRKAAEQQQEALSNRVKLGIKEVSKLQNTKQKLLIENEKLQAEIHKKNQDRDNQNRPTPVVAAAKTVEHIEKTVSYEKPKSFAEKINFLRNGELKEVVTVKKTESDNGSHKGDSDMLDILCNPNFSIAQLKELQQGIFDGLYPEEIKKIAKPELEVEMISEMRKFMCKRKGIAFTEVVPLVPQVPEGKDDSKTESISKDDEIITEDCVEEEGPDWE